MAGIYHELFIAASPLKIYNALTIQNELSAWWTPETIAEARKGSVAKFSFAGDYHKEMKIIELKPSEYVEWLCIAGADEWIGTSVSFKIKAGTKENLLIDHPEITDQLNQSKMPEGSVLTMNHENWKDYTAMFAECNYTWGRFLHSLKLFCETGKGKPWPNQHL